MVRAKLHRLDMKFTIALTGLLVAGLLGSLAVKAAGNSGTFSPTGSMNIPRVGHQAVLLRTGQVLIVGGVTGLDANPNSAEIYDPSTGKWTLTGSTQELHSGGTLTELSNGQVLLAGGVGGPKAVDGDCFTAAEIYNPGTGMWSATGDMTTGRCNQSAALLSNGDVLVAGGFTEPEDSLSSAELYNPVTGSWQATGSMTTGRQLAGAVRMVNGNVLIVSGSDVVNGSSTELTSAEIYNASQGRFSPTAGPGKSGVNLVLLSNGNVLDVGIAFYIPTTATWTETGAYPPRGLLNGDRAVLVGTGNVLITGFVDGYSPHPPSAAAVLYGSSSNEYVLTGSMTTPRLLQTMTVLPNGQVLVAGGSNRVDSTATAQTLASAELFTP